MSASTTPKAKDRRLEVGHKDRRGNDSNWPVFGSSDGFLPPTALEPRSSKTP